MNIDKNCLKSNCHNVIELQAEHVEYSDSREIVSADAYPGWVMATPVINAVPLWQRAQPFDRFKAVMSLAIPFLVIIGVLILIVMAIDPCLLNGSERCYEYQQQQALWAAQAEQSRIAADRDVSIAWASSFGGVLNTIGGIVVLMIVLAVIGAALESTREK